MFRDRDEFTAGQTLDEQTLAALDGSRALIVVCSPAAAQTSQLPQPHSYEDRHPASFYGFRGARTLDE
ncbi:MAG: hypothetical protein ACREDO_11485 [Methyloceanibacter sp.]